MKKNDYSKVTLAADAQHALQQLADVLTAKRYAGTKKY